jgi:biopolymer transport protein TolR
MSSGGGRRGMKKASLHAGPNMTPMVDLVMCLLIFFMLSSTFAVTEMFMQNSVPALEGVGIGSSKGTSKIPTVTQNISIKSLGGDKVLITAFERNPDRPDDVASLTAFFKTAKTRVDKDIQILIAPEKAVPWNDVVRVYDALAGAGFEHVAFTNAR